MCFSIVNPEMYAKKTATYDRDIGELVIKLYEFTYTDKFNEPKEDILKNVEDFLKTEAEQQRWATGYQIYQCEKVEQPSATEKKYRFEVYGRYYPTSSQQGGK